MDQENYNKSSGKKSLGKGVVIGVIGTLLISFAFNNVVYSNMLSFNNIDKKLSQIDKILSNYYVDDLTEEQYMEMYNNIYRGYVAGVGDKYTTYMDADTFNDFMESTNGEYAGIGASVSNDKEDNLVTIVNTFKNSPAEKVGLESGDKIMSVEGEEVHGNDLDFAISKLKGVPGSQVTFDVLKKSTGNIETVTAIRANIEVPTVEYSMIENKIGYIRLIGFDKVTTAQYKEAVNYVLSKNATSLIIDLRDNPGGLLEVVSDIADMHLPEGTIVYTEDKNGEREYLYSDDKQLGLPIVVLINEYSASASEVLTCALKDYGVATVVGEQSYGKGVVQTLFPMRDGSALKVTISKYYSPKGYSINGVGVAPDIEVPFDEMEKGSAYNLPIEQDVQLQKAIEVLSK